MGTDLFTEIDASITGSDEPGYLMLSARLRENSDSAIQQAEETIENEIQKLWNNTITEYELTRTINRFESNNTFSTIGFLPKAQAMAMGEMQGEDINQITSKYRAVTIEQIQQVAEQVLSPNNCSTLVYNRR
jgi:predicted Zn-dependent peptidase